MGSVVSVIRRVGLVAVFAPTAIILFFSLIEGGRGFLGGDPSSLVPVALFASGSFLTGVAWRWITGVRWDHLQSVFALAGVAAVALLAYGQAEVKRERLDAKAARAEQQRADEEAVARGLIKHPAAATSGSLREVTDPEILALFDKPQPSKPDDSTAFDKMLDEIIKPSAEPSRPPAAPFPPVPAVRSEQAMDAWRDECLKVKSGSECYREEGRLSKLPKPN